MKLKKKHLSAVLGLSLLLNTMSGTYASASSEPSTVNLPAQPAWGYFVDAYKNNTTANMTTSSNPTLGLLSGFSELWTPGATWDVGTKLNESVLDANIQKVIDIAASRTTAEADAAYYDDRRKQSYSVIDGLGSLTDVYRTNAGATTTINDIAADATTVKYDDAGNNAGDPNSSLGNIVNLVNTLRGGYSSTTPAKNYFSYKRPYRWADTSIIVPTLVPAISTTPASDGGFPSGHTNAAYLSAIAMAYAIPERFQELLTRASEIGNNRIVAGMHSPFDVIGGRVMATALSAAILSDPDNAVLKQAAYDDAHLKLLTLTGTAEDRFSNYSKNKEEYTERLTYGFSQIHSTTDEMIVPKGAEVLLETRLPYLDSTQRRWVLATTGLPSGYPVLDDSEGWGRLNLFAAADSYGAFVNDVVVTMDAGKGGFQASDSWRNNIAGTGKLTKAGTGTLRLEGSNSYSGGTQVDEGTLEGGSKTAFGSGDVTNNGGTLVEQVTGKLVIGGSFTQAAEGTLELNVASANDVIEAGGAIHVNGTLQVNFTNDYVPGTGTITLISHGANERTGQFSNVEVTGLPSSYNPQVVYQSDRIVLTVQKAAGPEAPAWGHFVDSYKNNSSTNMTVESNPTIGLLSGLLDLWTPGSSWDNGTKLNSAVLDANIQYVADLAKTRTEKEEIAAYYDDRRNQTYGAVDGLGTLADVYREKTGTYTTITSIPDDATTVKYNDGNGANKGGNSDSELGSMVDLIGKLRGNYASTTPAKNYYNYMRPWRWLDTSVIVPTLVPARNTTTPETDGGFPSGHTNASYLASLALAYTVPERFQEMLTRASEMGNNRIVAGMHSPLDVMGGRVMATALAAATLADPDNAELKQAAYDQAHEILLKETGTAEDRFSDYEKNKEDYTERLTYGFTPIASTTEAVVVPKGAEVLLETRQPYLSDDQRREVLATTGLPSGYPVLDDPEGWGRLNLFAAADGYGAFNSDVTVSLDADQGGFYASDRWRNDITGTGKLTKEGTGTLTLTGSNTYSGGTELNAGTLEGESASAFGTGNVRNSGGTLIENVSGEMTIGGDYTQAASGTLELNLSGKNDRLEIEGALHANGILRLNFSAYDAPNGLITILTHDKDQRTGQFASIETVGLPSQYKLKVIYNSDNIQVAVDATAPSWPADASLSGTNISQTKLTLNWPAATDDVAIASYSIYQGSTLLGTVSGTTYSYSVIGLSTGTSYSFSVVANDLVDSQSRPLLASIRTASGSSGSNGSNGEAGSGSNTETPQQTVDHVVIDSKWLSQAGSAVDTSNQRITVEVAGNANTAAVDLPLAIFAEWKQAMPHLVISIHTDNGSSYDLPASVIDTTKITQALGSSSNVLINVTIQKVTGAIFEQINQAARHNGVSLLGGTQAQIVEFKATASAGGKTLALDPYGNTYVSRNLVIKQSSDSSTVTAVLYDPATGEMSFVPALFQHTEGQTLVTIKSNHNGIFTVVQSSKSFEDLGNHWSKADVSLMASKLLVKGRTEQQFAPNAAITRAEFTQLLVRALGLNNKAAAAFTDINSKDWFAGAVGDAAKAGLINGFEDGSFRPNANITREQMTMMLAKAMDLVGKSYSVDSKQDELLRPFTDRGSISSWAQASVAQATGAGLVNGTTGNQFAPGSNATRAEAVVMLKRFLQYAEFMN